ncbi:hypothetical protein JHW43_007332 [Diplocarpon mali]|nr:hypothetical protein JHW43_007332 [Diplocarpon mali]
MATVDAQLLVTPEHMTASGLKEFRCTHCTKSFSRAEHLHRHALNHDENKGNNTCERCSAVFKRKDLLDRHMVRHREKDVEAGGEGMGRLQTRKRLWRDATGTVVAKRRPELERPKKTPSKTKKTIRKDASGLKKKNYSVGQENESLSPLRSLAAHISKRADSMETLVVAQTPSEDLWQVGDEVFSKELIPEPFDFLLNASWGSQSQESPGADILYNDLFAPDTGGPTYPHFSARGLIPTASSFNMPFTTATYYNWLFGNESWPDVLDAAAINPSKLDTTGAMIPAQAPSCTTSRIIGKPETSGTSVTSKIYGTDKSCEQPDFVYGVAPTNHDYSAGLHPQEESNPETSAANQILQMSKMADYNLAFDLGRNHCEKDSSSTMLFPAPTSRISEETHNTSSRSKELRKLPLVDEFARQAVLILIERAGPRTPDGSEINRYHPLLSLSIMQEYCNLYFTRFNVSYPLLHRATFDPAHVDPLLLTSVLLLGATFGTKESHLIAVCIHDTLRAQIFASTAFNTRPTLWVLQTILLVECFGKSRAGQFQHDMSHLFHGLLINLIRRSDCQSARCQSFGATKDVGPAQRWIAEVDAEQRRRLALLCFMWDTQHAVLFSQSLCMSAAELKLALPWNDALWEAETAEEWARINSTEQPQPQFLSVMKQYINPRPGASMWPINAFSRVLMLHGLMSIAWDLNRRDQTSLGVAIAGQEEPWQARIARSYDAWKTDFDIYSKQTLLYLSSHPSPKSDFQRFCVTHLAIYDAAYIALHVEINDLQIYAGASHIVGRPVTSSDRARSRQRIETWAAPRSLAAAQAGSHAARILRDGLRKLQDWDSGDYFHYPWCLYLATLTCWAFQTCSRGEEERAGGPESADEEDRDWDARAEMSALVSAMTRAELEDLWRVAGRYRTVDLPRVMLKPLARIRWAVVQEGMIVLKGMVERTR